MLLNMRRLKRPRRQDSTMSMQMQMAGGTHVFSEVEFEEFDRPGCSSDIRLGAAAQSLPELVPELEGEVEVS